MSVLYSLIFVLCSLIVAFDTKLDNLVFPAVENEQKGAEKDAKFQIVKVKPTVPDAARQMDLMMCTAYFLRWRVYFTVSRCLVTLRVPFTVIEHDGKEERVKAFLQPRNVSKPYEDMSFIVTYSSPKKEHKENLFVEDKDEYVNYTLHGFVSEFDNTNNKMIHTMYRLPVKASNHLCPKLINQNYQVPCFSPCTVEEHKANLPQCQNYIRGLGHSLNAQDGFVRGLTSWAITDEKQALPVGYAKLYSTLHNETIECADKIANSTTDDDFYKLCAQKHFFIRRK